MESYEAWQKILLNLSKGKSDIPTKPINGRKPSWFSAEVVDDVIKIDGAISNTPSCNLKKPRKLTAKNFNAVYPYYTRRNNGEEVSKEVKGLTGSQVYYYGLISRFIDKN